jgi:hypothetical protein
MVDRSDAQMLTANALQMGAKALRGFLQKEEESGNWTLGNIDLSAWLDRYQGQELVVIVVPLQSEAPPLKVCRTCGREYQEPECPHCREVWQRLRGS